MTHDQGAGLIARRQLRLRSGPQAALMPSGMCLEISSILRTRFLLHQHDILLESHGRAVEPLDRELLDPRTPMPDVKLLADRLQHTGPFPNLTLLPNYQSLYKPRDDLIG